MLHILVSAHNVFLLGLPLHISPYWFSQPLFLSSIISYLSHLIYHSSQTIWHPLMLFLLHNWSSLIGLENIGSVESGSKKFSFLCLITHKFSGYWTVFFINFYFSFFLCDVVQEVGVVKWTHNPPFPYLVVYRSCHSRHFIVFQWFHVLFFPHFALHYLST